MNFFKKTQKMAYAKSVSLAVALLSISTGAYAVDGKDANTFSTAIQTASQDIAGTFESVSTLCLVIGGVVGLVGGIQIYIKWNNGDQDVTKRIIGWGGAALFLVATGSILKAIFIE